METSAIEHHAVLHACEYLERFDFKSDLLKAMYAVTYAGIFDFGVLAHDDPV